MDDQKAKNKVQIQVIEGILEEIVDQSFSNHDFNESSNYEIDDKLSKFKCDLCSEMFSSESNLMTHVELNHDVSFSKNSNEIDIEKNPSKFNNKEKYNSGGKFQCPYCKSKFSQKHNLKTHVKKKHDEKIGLDNHVQQKHEDKHTKIHDERQESLHIEKKPFKCSICSKMFQFKDIMQLHKDDHKNVHGGKPFDCELCGLDFQMKEDLKMHIQSVHSDANNTFNESVDVDDNQDEDRYDTDNETILENKNEHIQAIYSEKHFNISADQKSKKYPCNVCNKKFSSVQNLKSHTKIKHNGAENDETKPHEKVNKKSTNSLSPSKRKKILLSNCNSGGKFPCPYCKSKFSKKQNLKTHVKKKHNEKTEEMSNKVKKFECPICSKSFQFKDIMQLHKDDHTKIHDKTTR